MADDGEPTTDDAFARLLRAALGDDPLPPGLVDRATELVALADLDAELAALADERADELAGVRGGPATDAGALVFTSADGAVTIELTVAGDRVEGQLLGPDGEVPVVVQRADGSRHTAAVDVLGRFAVTGLAAGPARVLVGASPTLVATDWFVI